MSWLALGDTGPAVRSWQRIVGAHPDGTFGPATELLVKAWQAAHGVEADGAIGPQTRGCVAPGALIKPYEGLRLQTYDDHDGQPLSLVSGLWRRPDGAICKGYPTIGWGRRLYPGETIQTCTRAEADAWFDADLGKTRLPAVKRAFSLAKLPEEPGQVAAASSFAYNCGTGALASLAAHGFTEAAWLDYVRSKGIRDAGLVMRREEEFALFAGAVDEATPDAERVG